MDTTLPDECLEERCKGNMRAQLFDISMEAEWPVYVVKVVASNPSAGQSKIVAGVSGLDRKAADGLLQRFCRDFSHYDWEKGEIVMED